MLNPADSAFLARLEALVPQGTLRAPEARYLEEPRGRWQGIAGAVACPRSAEEVSVIVREAAAARVGARSMVRAVSVVRRPSQARLRLRGSTARVVVVAVRTRPALRAPMA